MVKIVRIIDRLNIGGPAIHVTLVSAALTKPGFDSLIVHGQVEPHEGSMERLPQDRGVRTLCVRGLGRSVSPLKDLAALWRLYRLLRRERPDIVHTHKAKAGALGRVAARLAGVPVVVHTFHGHVLSGYFSPLKTRLVILAERLLARLADRIVVLSERQKQDICKRYRVASAGKVCIVPLGFELARFHNSAAAREEARQRLGLPPDTPAVAIVGRLAHIKNHRLFLQAAALVLQDLPTTQFVVVGDGELRAELEQHVHALGIARSVSFTGWLDRMERVYPAFDAVALSSDNEGTPVVLIEAMACGVPVIATNVGGVADVLGEGRFGALVPPRDPAALAAGLMPMLKDPHATRQRAAAARSHVLAAHGVERLARDLKALYGHLLARREHGERAK